MFDIKAHSPDTGDRENNYSHQERCNSHAEFQQALKTIEELKSNCVSDSLMLLGSHNELNAMKFKLSFFIPQKYTALFIASELYIALYTHFFCLFSPVLKYYT